MKRKSIKTFTRTSRELANSIERLHEAYPVNEYDIEITRMNVSRDMFFVEIWRKPL